MNDHIVTSYDNEIQELRGIISRMGGLAKDQFRDAMQALRNGDTELAQSVRRSDKELDALEEKAEETAIFLFATRSPVADDLREVIAALKVTTIIERIGDYAKNIAKRTIAISKMEDEILIPKLLTSMEDIAISMIDNIMHAYATRDADMAVDVWERDEELDNLHNAAHRQTLAYMMEHPDQIVHLTHLVMIAKNIERIGDQTTNIAEQLYYSVTAKKLDQDRPKGDLTSLSLETNTPSPNKL